MKVEFEWDDAKAKTNLNSHGVSFSLAKSVFRDVFAVEFVDDREDGEERFVTIGMADGRSSYRWSTPNVPSEFA